ncbi:MAG TPA: pitrilysin family protein [Dermatophilaceae bacterium]|mgnify:CR=1 FL=1|nr:pitrilysin family protein [Dermatophilaceae bacterium]
MPDIAYPIAERTLDNGLRVVVSEDRTVPTVSVCLWVKVGSRDEVAGRTGLAHLFEHLMFQGSRNVASGEHFSALMGVGGRLNATTWFDRTNYFETVPKGALELALWLEADRHGRLLDAVTQANLDNQRDVVKEEKRQRYDNAPYGNALRDVYATIFPADHPYHHPTIGSMEDLEAATLADVHEFFRRHYGPNNSVLTLVGDVTPEQAFELVERHFGQLPASAQRREEGRIPVLAPLAEPVRLERHEPVPNDRVYLAFRLPPDAGDDFHAVGLALDVLGGLASSRLVERLVREERLATGLSAHPMGLAAGVSLGLISVDVSAGVDPAQVEQEVCAELDRFIADGPTAEELEAAGAETERAWLSALAAQDTRADTICHYTALFDDPHYVNTFLDQVLALDAEAVRRAAERYLQPASRAVVTYLAAAAEQTDEDVA